MNEQSVQGAKQMIRVVVTLASGEAREALGFFRREFAMEGENGLTLQQALERMKTPEGKSLADALVKDGKVKATVGLFLDGMNIENLEGLKTQIENQKNVVVIELISRIAGG